MRNLKLILVLIYLIPVSSFGDWIVDQKTMTCGLIPNNLTVEDAYSSLSKEEKCKMKEYEDLGFFAIKCPDTTIFVAKKVNGCNSAIELLERLQASKKIKHK